MVRLRLEVLGPLRVFGDKPITLTRASRRRLLAILALDAGSTISIDRLIDRYWRDKPPDGAKAALQTHVSALRRLMGPEAIVTEGPGYRLALDAVALDSIDFTDRALAARRAAENQEWEAARESSEEALAMWRGEPFPDLDDEFARPEVVRLAEINQALWEVWAEAMLRMGRPEDVVADLERLVLEHPYRERLWEHLMTARYRLGRHAEALRAYQKLSDHLAEIGVEPGPRVRRLEERILLHDVESRNTPHNLPPYLTTFIGRETELGEIIKLIGDHRLVTLTGAGGSGKTRLAVEASSRLLESFPEGCWFVGLADLQDPDRIPLELAGTLGLAPQGKDPLEDIIAAIGASELLLILDNCEHLAGEVADVVRRLLESISGIKVLATSRGPLHIEGEALYQVPSMVTPSPGRLAPDVSNTDAVRLFVDRARLVDRDFEPDDAYLQIVSVCRRLEGMPLAIELAAAKIRSFSVDSIDRLLRQNVLSLASPSLIETPRHRTLEAVVRWSYDLLEDDERTLLERLSVFRGGFDLRMARWVSGHSTDVAVATALEQLVDRSLIVRERGSADRYRLLEPIRQFAVARLTDAGLDTAARLRHLEWCVDFSSKLEEEIYGPDQFGSLDRLSIEADNLSAALKLAGERSEGNRVSLLASVLAWHWLDTGVFTRCRLSLMLALQHVGGDAHREADIRSRLGTTSWLLGDAQTGMEEAGRAYELVRNLEPSPEKAWVGCRLATLYTLQVDQDPSQAIRLTEEALEIAEAAEATASTIAIRALLSRSLAWAGQVDEGVRVYRSALEDAKRFADPATTLRVYAYLGDVVFPHPKERRHLPRQLVGEMLSLFPLDEWGDKVEFGWLPWVFIQSGEWDKAENALRRWRKPGIEGYEREGTLLIAGTLAWMRGDLASASAAMADLEREGINPRYYHDYYPLRIDLATDLGDLELARSLTDTYLAFEVDPSEEAKKLGALHPLVRAEVNTALAADEDLRRAHWERAGEVLERMRELLTRFPSPVEGSVAMETHGTHLVFALAEMSRLTGPDPEAWREAVARADYAYFRLYARARLAESIAEADGYQQAAALFDEVSVEADRLGAARLSRLIAQLRRRVSAVH